MKKKIFHLKMKFHKHAMKVFQNLNSIFDSCIGEKISKNVSSSLGDKIKVTFLQDVEETDENGKKVNKNVGTSFEIKRNNTDMQTKFDITLNSIEEKKVIAKLKLDITTQGTKTSKKYLNDVIIKYNDHERIRKKIPRGIARRGIDGCNDTVFARRKREVL